MSVSRQPLPAHGSPSTNVSGQVRLQTDGSPSGIASEEIPRSLRNRVRGPFVNGHMSSRASAGSPDDRAKYTIEFAAGRLSARLQPRTWYVEIERSGSARARTLGTDARQVPSGIAARSNREAVDQSQVVRSQAPLVESGPHDISWPHSHGSLSYTLRAHVNSLQRHGISACS